MGTMKSGERMSLHNELGVCGMLNPATLGKAIRTLSHLKHTFECSKIIYNNIQ